MKSRNCSRLALSLGLAFGVMAPALAVADRVETEKANVVRGSNGGQDGYWIDYVTRTYHFTEDQGKIAARDAFLALFGHEPSDAELSNFLTLKSSAGAGIDDRSIATVVKNITIGTVSLNTAQAQMGELKRLTNENRNSNYLTALPAEYLNWSPGKPLGQATIDKVGAEPRKWENRFVNAYNGIGIDPDTKVFRDGPLAGKKLSTDFNSMVDQLSGNGYITFDWNYDTLLKDLGGQGTLDSYGQGRGFWASNLFGKDNLHDSALFQRYSNRVGDGRPRTWVTYDGIGRFNSWNDLDVLLAVNYSSAAKLVAESKALRAMGLSAAADAKVNQARNIVLLDGNDHDPLVLDLNGNGKIDVTGLSAAKYRKEENKKFVKEGAVKFDLLANGRPIQTEWIKDGDGFLIDNRKNAALEAVMAGKPLTGASLFGDIEGYPGGFLKLAASFDKEARFASTKTKLSKDYGILKGEELNDLMVWVDNGDGVATREELKSLKAIGITEIGILPNWVKDKKGEMFEQGYFVRNGKKHLIQEVWFMGQ